MSWKDDVRSLLMQAYALSSLAAEIVAANSDDEDMCYDFDLIPREIEATLEMWLKRSIVEREGRG